MKQASIRSILSLTGVAIVTVTAYRLIPVNATTVGFAYLLVVLFIASVWGWEAATLCSIGDRE